jgi:hypothetical protein
MPLDSYTWIHKDAILNEAEKKSVLAWVESARAFIQGKYSLPDEPERNEKRN